MAQCLVFTINAAAAAPRHRPLLSSARNGCKHAQDGRLLRKRLRGLPRLKQGRVRGRFGVAALCNAQTDCAGFTYYLLTTVVSIREAASPSAESPLFPWASAVRSGASTPRLAIPAKHPRSPQDVDKRPLPRALHLEQHHQALLSPYLNEL